ncbi:MAG: transposase [Beijerinckiaceae bacterium]|nr:transposase [Beijerinckiaceae bacterium]
MQRRKFGREFKVEAARLIKERGVAVRAASARFSTSTAVRDWSTCWRKATPVLAQVSMRAMTIIACSSGDFNPRICASSD